MLEAIRHCMTTTTACFDPDLCVPELLAQGKAERHAVEAVAPINSSQLVIKRKVFGRFPG
jgi:hypothetical protein